MTERNLFGPRHTTWQPRPSSKRAWRGCGDHRGGRRVKALRASSACAEHDRQLGGGSPLSSLMAAKD